jgi:hypothetical protein
VIDLLEESERLLQNADISTQRIETSRGKALSFESETVLGFMVAYQDSARLIEGWSADTEALVAENQLGLRRAQSKGWNTYTVFLAVAEANYGQRVLISGCRIRYVGSAPLGSSHAPPSGMRTLCPRRVVQSLGLQRRRPGL